MARRLALALMLLMMLAGPARAQADPFAGAHERLAGLDDWYGIYSGNRNIGAIHVTSEALEGGWVRVRLEASAARGSSATETIELGPGLAVRLFRQEEVGAGERKALQVIRTPAGESVWKLEVSDPAAPRAKPKAKIRKLTVPPATITRPLVLAVGGAIAWPEGGSAPVRFFDPDDAKVLEGEGAWVGWEQVEVRDRTVRAAAIRVTYPPNDKAALLHVADGKVVQLTVEGSEVRMILGTEVEARAHLGPPEPEPAPEPTPEPEATPEPEVTPAPEAMPEPEATEQPAPAPELAPEAAIRAVTIEFLRGFMTGKPRLVRNAMDFAAVQKKMAETDPSVGALTVEAFTDSFLEGVASRAGELPDADADAKLAEIEPQLEVTIDGETAEVTGPGAPAPLILAKREEGWRIVWWAVFAPEEPGDPAPGPEPEASPEPEATPEPMPQTPEATPEVETPEPGPVELPKRGEDGWDESLAGEVPEKLGASYVAAGAAERLALLSEAKADKKLEPDVYRPAVDAVVLERVRRGETAEERLCIFGALRSDAGKLVTARSDARKEDGGKTFRLEEPPADLQNALGIDFLAEAAGARPSLEALSALARVRAETDWGAHHSFVLAAVLDGVLRDEAFAKGDFEKRLEIVWAMVGAEVFSDHERARVERAAIVAWILAGLREGRAPAEMMEALDAKQKAKKLTFFASSWGRGILEWMGREVPAVDPAAEKLGEAYAAASPAERYALALEAKQDEAIDYKVVRVSLEKIALDALAGVDGFEAKLRALGALRDAAKQEQQTRSDARKAEGKKPFYFSEPPTELMSALALQYLAEVEPEPLGRAGLARLDLVRETTSWAGLGDLVLSIAVDVLVRDEAFFAADPKGRLAIVRELGDQKRLTANARSVLEQAILCGWLTAELAAGADPTALGARVEAMGEAKEISFFSRSWADGILDRLAKVHELAGVEHGGAAAEPAKEPAPAPETPEAAPEAQPETPAPEEQTPAPETETPEPEPMPAEPEAAPEPEAESAPAPDAEAKGDREGAVAVMKPFLAADADPVALLRALQPTRADHAAIFGEANADAALEGYAGLWEKVPTLEPGEKQTELLVYAATSEQIQAWEGDAASHFPGGWKDVGGKLQPGLTFYRIKFVEPGESAGLSIDGLVFVNGRWVLVPKPWRALRD